MTLRSRYFDDWKGGPIVLLWGETTDMRVLRDFLRSGFGPSNTPPLGSFCEAVDGRTITVRAVSDERDSGMHLAGGGLEWKARRDRGAADGGRGARTDDARADRRHKGAEPRLAGVCATAREEGEGVRSSDKSRANPKADAAMAVLLLGGPTPNGYAARRTSFNATLSFAFRFLTR